MKQVNAAILRSGTLKVNWKANNFSILQSGGEKLKTKAAALQKRGIILFDKKAAT